jgi:dienelactone hydrolase
VIATPKTAGKHPTILLLHGGGYAEVEKAMAWAQRGYVAVAVTVCPSVIMLSLIADDCYMGARKRLILCIKRCSD